MNTSSRKSVSIVSVLLILGVLLYFAVFYPRHIGNEIYLGGLILLEFLIAAVWQYTRVFFPVVLLAFLLAGLDVPFASVWTPLRWLFLAMGGFIGALIAMKERRLRYGSFHLVALFAVLCAGASAAVSDHPVVAAEKALSLFLLFLYGSTGVRITAHARPQDFFSGLVMGGELLVGAAALSYALGREVFGNPNSLGAVMGVIGAPILAWSALIEDKRSTRMRHSAFYILCMFLAFYSHARAGWAAALISSGVLCIAMRKYRAIIAGTISIALMIGIVGIVAPDQLSSVPTTTVYKNGDQEHGLFASRRTPWQTALDNIRQHPWFGMGFGTTVEGDDPWNWQGHFASTSSVTAEFGSSYLAILVGVGIIGAIPVFLLLWLLLRKILATFKWLRHFQTPAHPGVPLALVAIAGLVHASFEDWMFAPGYYLCIFFWSLVFLLIDFAPPDPKLVICRQRMSDSASVFISAHSSSKAALGTK